MKKTILSTFKLSLGLLGASLLATNSYAEDAVGSVVKQEVNDIIIDQGLLVTNRVGIADFSYQGVNLAPNTIENIIAYDLRTTAKFETFTGDKLPEQPNNGINPDVWLNADITYLVAGQVTGVGDKIKVDYSLFDMTGAMCDVGKACISRSYMLPASEARQLGHLVASNIFKKFTKVDGAFTTKIAYVQQPIASVEKYNLVVSDWDGANAKTVYSSNKPILSPNFSPDGNSLVFSNFSVFASEIKRYSLATGQVTTLVKDMGNNNAPAYSPDGKYIAYSHGNNGKFDIYLYNVANGQKVNLTRGLGKNTEPSWYGNTIIFTSDRGGSPQIYQMSANGSGATRVSRTAGQTTNAEVANNGKYLVMINKDRLVAQDVKSGKVANITNTFLDQNVTLSPNGFNAIYSASVGNKASLFITSLDGQFQGPIKTGSGVITNPTWQKKARYLSE